MAKSPQKKTPTRAKAAPAAAGSTATATATTKRINEMVRDDEATKRLKTTLDEIDHQRAIQIKNIKGKEDQLVDRFVKLDEEKLKTASANGNTDVSGDDVLEINAGGKVITVKRATMTQV